MMAWTMNRAELLVCATLRGERQVWRELEDPAAQTAFVESAARHRVAPLLVWQLDASGEWRFWPRAVRARLGGIARAEAALEIARRSELRRVLAAFAAARIPLILFKGAALAYAHYPEPWLRPREDTDLLVRGEDATRARALLGDAGYEAPPAQTGGIVAYQRPLIRLDAVGARHACDLHWKIANPAPFADLLSADDLLCDAKTITIDDAAARIPSRVHALLLSCWHRVAHHRDDDSLLWSYDLHLLGHDLSDTEAARAAALAQASGTAAICARELALAAGRYATRLPGSLITSLEVAAAGTSSPAVAYLGPRASRVDLLRADLRALPDWRSRLALIRQHLLPPADYMLSARRSRARGLLPVFYLWRILRGAPRWFRRG
jgi:hypothetical protein